MNAHDRFEGLAGAIALGEATPEERSLFAAHRQTCPACREDALDAASSPLALIADARECEVWRPALDRAVLARIRDRQQQRSRWTVSALGWAAGLSIAANVVFASGLAGSVSRVLAPPTLDAPVAITSAGIRLPAQTFARIGPASVANVRLYAPVRFVHHAPRPVARQFFARTHAVPAVPATVVPQTEPDALADLLSSDTVRAGRKVALESPRTESQPLQP